MRSRASEISWATPLFGGRSESGYMAPSLYTRVKPGNRRLYRLTAWRALVVSTGSAISIQTTAIMTAAPMTAPMHVTPKPRQVDWSPIHQNEQMWMAQDAWEITVTSLMKVPVASSTIGSMVLWPPDGNAMSFSRRLMTWIQLTSREHCGRCITAAQDRSDNALRNSLSQSSKLNASEQSKRPRQQAMCSRKCGILPPLLELAPI